MEDQDKSMRERWAPPTPEPAEAPGDAQRERGYASEQPATLRESSPDAGQLEGDEPRAAQIRSDIQQTRAEMGETIEAIQDRLRPGTVVSRAAESVRDAAVGKVRQMTTRDVYEDVPRRAADWYRRSGLMQRIRENPFPTAIAATSLAWVAFAQRRPRDYQPRYDRPWHEPETLYRTEGTSEEWETTSGGMRGAATESIERVREATSDAAQRVRETGERAQRRAQHFTREHTLTAALIAAGAGVAAGLLLPETRREGELLGTAGESMVERAREVARNAAEQVRSTAEQVQRVAGDTVGKLGGSGGTGGTGSGPRQGA